MSRTRTLKAMVVPGWALLAREHKQGWFEDHGTGEIPALLLVERGGRGRAVVFMGNPDNDHLYHRVWVAVAGMAPDALVLVHDVWTAERPWDPAGEEFHADLKAGRVRLDQMAKEGGLERGTVGQAMVAIRFEQGRPTRAYRFPYRIATPDDGTPRLAWLDDQADDFGGEPPAGDIPATIGRILAETRPYIDQPELARLAPAGATREELLLTCGRAALKALEEHGCVVQPLED